MKFGDLQGKTESELQEKAYQLKKGVYSLRIQKKMNQLTNTAQIRAHRRDLARVLMKISQLKTK